MTQTPDFTSFWLPLYLPLLLVLVVYRLTRLVVRDTFPPVLWVRDRLAGGWRPLTDREAHDLKVMSDDMELEMRRLWSTMEIHGVESRYVYRWRRSPFWLAELLTCPWCASGWITGVVVLATDLTYGLPVPWLMGPAVWGAAALLASKEWA